MQGRQCQCEAGTHSLSHTYNRGNGGSAPPRLPKGQAHITTQLEFTYIVSLVDIYKGPVMAPDTVD
jgi:hypothetical protein